MKDVIKKYLQPALIVLLVVCLILLFTKISENDSLNAQITKLNDQVAGLSGEKDDLTTAKADLETANADLTAKLDEANAAKDDLATAKTGLETANADLTTKLDEANAAKDELATAKTGLETANADLNDKLDKANATIDELNAKLDKANADIDDLNEQLDIASFSLDAMAEERDDLNAKLDKANADIEDLKAQLAAAAPAETDAPAETAAPTEAPAAFDFTLDEYRTSMDAILSVVEVGEATWTVADDGLSAEATFESFTDMHFTMDAEGKVTSISAQAVYAPDTEDVEMFNYGAALALNGALVHQMVSGSAEPDNTMADVLQEQLAELMEMVAASPDYTAANTRTLDCMTLTMSCTVDVAAQATTYGFVITR